MSLEEIPTTKEDFKKKEKEWLGFERALNFIGLKGSDVLERIKRGQPPYRCERTQRHRCDIAYQQVLRTGRRGEGSPPSRILTAVKSKAKRPDSPPRRKERQEHEKATSSRTEKKEKESRKSTKKEKKPPISTSPGPCTGECKEIIQEGQNWDRCELTCKVEEDHASKDCRCKEHMSKEKRKDDKDPILEAAKKETRFKFHLRGKETIEEEKNELTAQDERRIKAEFDKANKEAAKATEAYEKMLMAKTSALKPAKTTKED
jgi:hypothetical protein